MSDVFEGLPDAFVETFGEDVEYVGITGTVQAIWLPNSGLSNLGFADSASVEHEAVHLHVRVADVPDPQEGDMVTRVATGEVRKVVAPIQRDGNGMISCMLAIVA